MVKVDRLCDTASDARRELSALDAAVELGWPQPRHLEKRTGRGFMARLSRTVADAKNDLRSYERASGSVKVLCLNPIYTATFSIRVLRSNARLRRRG